MTFVATDITLYIPYYEAAATIAACLAGVAAQTLVPARLLVIDDGSAQPFVAPAGVEVIRHPQNRGLAAARNTALAACQTPLLAALDADVVPEPDWLAHMLGSINRYGVAGVGGRLLEHYQCRLADRWRAVHMCQHWGELDQAPPRFLYGANTLLQAALVRAAGGYDPRLRTNNEDRTLCDNLTGLGYATYYCAAARCRHLRRDTVMTILAGYWKWHHAKGLLRGDFATPAGLQRRLDEVNFGIFRYRFDLDSQHNRHELLGLDAALPWVFSLLDLRQFSACTGEPLSAQLRQRLLALAPQAAQPLLQQLLPTLEANRQDLPDWGTAYLAAFAHALDSFAWHKHCANVELWQPLLAEIQAVENN